MVCAGPSQPTAPPNLMCGTHSTTEPSLPAPPHLASAMPFTMSEPSALPPSCSAGTYAAPWPTTAPPSLPPQHFARRPMAMPPQPCPPTAQQPRVVAVGHAVGHAVVGPAPSARPTVLPFAHATMAAAAAATVGCGIVAGAGATAAGEVAVQRKFFGKEMMESELLHEDGVPVPRTHTQHSTAAIHAKGVDLRNTRC